MIRAQPFRSKMAACLRRSSGRLGPPQDSDLRLVARERGAGRALVTARSSMLGRDQTAASLG